MAISILLLPIITPVLKDQIINQNKNPNLLQQRSSEDGSPDPTSIIPSGVYTVSQNMGTSPKENLKNSAFLNYGLPTPARANAPSMAMIGIDLLSHLRFFEYRNNQ